MGIILAEIEIQKQLAIIDMKTIGIIGLILSIVGLFFGLYCQFQIIPSFNALDTLYDLSKIERAKWNSLADLKFLIGSITLFLGALAAVIGLVVGLKKQKIGWVILVLSFISFILGVIQSTHMFS